MICALFIVGQARSFKDDRMKIKIKESIKYFKGDIFFVLEEEESLNAEDINSFFGSRETIFYKFKHDKFYKNSVILMSYGWYNCLPLLEKYEARNKTRYQLIYKTRPDLLLCNYIPSNLNINLNVPIVWGETLGGYGTDINNPDHAIKDTFNIITRPACEDFFKNFHLSVVNRYLFYPKNGYTCNEALLGYFLYKQKILKRKLNVKRFLVRNKPSEILSDQQISLDSDIEKIDINEFISIT